MYEVTDPETDHLRGVYETHEKAKQHAEQFDKMYGRVKNKHMIVYNKNYVKSSNHHVDGYI